VFSGEKISPIEVDAVLLSHPDIAQAVAFGVPDEKYGEEVRNRYTEVKPHCSGPHLACL
jgi:acyl-CoA synthetase (AMP-forming)/AMP-acid ligase II